MDNIISYNLSLANSNINSPRFKGRYQVTDAGNPYYHSNTGRNVGIAGCGILTAAAGLLNHKKAKYALYTMLATSPLILTGILTDKIRNNKNKNTADLVEKYGFEEMSEIDKNIKVSDNNHVYKKCYSGAFVGGIFSSVLAIAMFGFLAKKSVKSGQSMKDSLKNALKEIFNDIFAVDGMLCGPCIPITLGVFLDYFANLDAKKHA
jgi:hypothetical protein